MQISILKTSQESRPSKNGKTYQVLNVAYKNLTHGGKIEGKDVFSFGDTESTFKALAAAQEGEVYDIDNKKNAGGYWTWFGATKSEAGAVAAPAAGKAAFPAPKSNYETPEERERRQHLIVRQSSLSAAVSTLATGKAAVNPEDVVALAERYVGFVFAQPEEVKTAPDFEDDIPF